MSENVRPQTIPPKDHLDIAARVLHRFLAGRDYLPLEQLKYLYQSSLAIFADGIKKISQ